MTSERVEIKNLKTTNTAVFERTVRIRRDGGAGTGLRVDAPAKFTGPTTFCGGIDAETITTDKLLVGPIQALKGSPLVSNGVCYQPVAVGLDDQILVADSTQPEGVRWANATPYSGDVDGPASAGDNAICRFDGVTGKVIQNSGVTISDIDVVQISSLVPSQRVQTDGSKNLVSVGGAIGWNEEAIQQNKVRIGITSTAADADQIALLGTSTGTAAMSFGNGSIASHANTIVFGNAGTSDPNHRFSLSQQGVTATPGTPAVLSNWHNIRINNVNRFVPLFSAAGTIVTTPPIPWQTGANSVNRVKIGTTSIATSTNQIALLGGTTGTNGIAIGRSSTVSHSNATCLGVGCVSQRDNTFTIPAYRRIYENFKTVGAGTQSFKIYDLTGKTHTTMGDIYVRAYDTDDISKVKVWKFSNVAAYQTGSPLLISSAGTSTVNLQVAPTTNSWLATITFTTESIVLNITGVVSKTLYWKMTSGFNLIEESE